MTLRCECRGGPHGGYTCDWCRGIAVQDETPDPAVVTPDASGVENNSAARGVEDHPPAGDALTEAEREALAAGWPDFWKVHAAVQSIIANHVAAAREADRAKEAIARLDAERYAEKALEYHSRAEAAEERLAQSESTLAGLRRVHGETVARLAGLVAKIEALADDLASEVDWSSGRNNYGDNEAWESAARQLRALIPADAAMALDAVREKAKAEERERIAQAIEAERERSEWILKAGMQRAATIARHTPGADQ